MSELKFIKDETTEAKVRYLSFKGNNHRYDLAIILQSNQTDEILLLDLNQNRFTLLSKEKLENEGYIEHALNYTEIDAEELRIYLREII